MHIPLRILIVEDRPTTVMAIKESLEQTSYTVCGEAADHKSAIALMKSELPDLAIIDIGLKGQPDGIVTAQELIRIKPIPFLYLTVHTDDTTYNRAKNTNPVAFLHKPLRVREFAMQIDLALHNYYNGNTSVFASASKPTDYEGNKTVILSTSDYLYIPDKSGKFRIHISSIIFLEADGSYTKLFLTKNELDRLEIKTDFLVVTINLGNILGFLPTNFYRLSRFKAINLDHLERIETSQVILNGYKISLGEGNHRQLVDHLNTNRPNKRR